MAPDPSLGRVSEAERACMLQLVCSANSMLQLP